jgi:iron complex outermembrane receptor protein
MTRVFCPIFLLALLPLARLMGHQVAPVTAGSNQILKLDTLKVSGSRISAGDSAGPEPTDVYDAHDLEESGAFDMEEFFSRLAESPAGTEQLVLIDGQPTYLDISKLPPEMVASIEVSNYGALPQYGAYANGRVINIRLKSDYRGGSIAFLMRGAFEGGGMQNGVTISGGVTHNKLRVTYGLSYKKQQPLMASDRSFSADQDHMPWGGTDLRLLWGDTAVVQAVNGYLPGVVDARGQPTAVALVPENSAGTALLPNDFISPQIFPPAAAATAAGQRRFDSSAYRTLIVPSEDKSLTFEISRPLGERVEVSLSGAATSERATRSLAPPVTPVSGKTVVPAAYNPFGHDVEVGLVHRGFGPVRETDQGTAAQLGFALNGRWATTWHWNFTLGEKWNRTTQHVIDLDQDKFAAALAGDDPALRFNPFGDELHNVALYPSLAVDRSSVAESSDARLNLSANGDVMPLPGGPMRLVVRGSYSDQTHSKSYENPGDFNAVDTHRHENGESVVGTFFLPWAGQKNNWPWLHRLDTHFTTGYSARSSSSGGSLNSRFGLLWSPHQALSVNATYGVRLQAPAHFVADLQPLVGETLIDPRRFPSTATDVELIARDFDAAARTRSDQMLLSATFEPAWWSGLQLSATYDRQERENLTSAGFKPQDLIYNELTLPGRVIRAAPDETDLALGQPGHIVSIDTTPADGARQESSGLALSLRYRLVSQTLGQFRLMASARHPLTRRYEVVRGIPFVFESDNQLNPPDWTEQGMLLWNRKGWNANASLRHVDEIVSGNIVQPSTTVLGVQVGYRFSRAVWGRWGRGLQMAVGLGNVLAGAPAFADTLNGFRSGSPLGRTYSVAIRLPLGGSPRSEEN